MFHYKLTKMKYLNLIKLLTVILNLLTYDIVMSI